MREQKWLNKNSSKHHRRYPITHREADSGLVELDDYDGGVDVYSSTSAPIRDRGVILLSRRVEAHLKNIIRAILFQ